MRDATGEDAGRVGVQRRTGPPALALALALVGLVAACRTGPPPSPTDLGEAAFAERAYSEADAHFERALAADPRDVRALHGRARVAFVRRDPESALRFYARLASVDRSYLERSTRADYAAALLEAGRGRIEAGKPAAALDALRTLQKLAPAQAGLVPQLARALTGRAEELAMHGRRQEAMTMFREAITLAPQAAAAYVGAAEILIAGGRKKEALALLTEARRHDGGDPRVRALIVRAMGVY